MITRIELHNFMSHRETVIEPSPGLTVLVGPNNCGKSAVVAALQVLSQNRNSKLFTRHGEKLCSVVVHTSEGHVIEWRRKDSPSYRVNGQVFDRLGRSGIPDELQPLLRLPTVADEDDENFNVHFGNQKSPIFLLGSSAGTAAKFFASSSDAIRLVEMQQRHLQRVTDARRQRKQLEAEAAVVNAELVALDATVPLADQLTDLESLHAELDQIEAAIVELDRSIADIVVRSDRVDQYAAGTEALQSLTPPPVLANPDPLSEQISRIETTRRLSQRLANEMLQLTALPLPPKLEQVFELERIVEQLDTSSARLQRLEHCRLSMATLEAPPVLVDSNALEALIGQLVRGRVDVATTADRCARLSKLEPVPELTTVDGLSALLESLVFQTQETQRYGRTASIASKTEPPPLLSDESGLSALLEKLGTAQWRAAGLEESLAALDGELATTAADMRDAVRGQSCPTCGQPFDADQLLALGGGGHAHG